tara:strand:+ start:24 stop:1349 length:1326 start_codon:yes stop_codon:yes gene_type:complete
MRFDTAGAERLRIQSDGKLGINTTSATLNGNEEGIHIVSDEYPTLHLTNMTTGHGSSNGTSLTLNNTGETILRNDHASHIRFDTNGSNERMRITAGGAVLINGQALSDVHTNADDVVIGNTSASLMGLSLVTSSSGYATLQFSDGGGNKNQGQIAYNHAEDSMALTTAENVRLKILSDGNVNIGNKAYVAQNGTVDSLRIGYGLNLYEDSYTGGNDNYIILANNLYYGAASGGNRYIRSDEASRIMMQAGQLWFQNAAAGTAGDVVTLVNRLKIEADGSMYVTNSSGSLANLTLKKAANDNIDYLQCRGTANGLNMKVSGNGGIGNVQANDTNLSDQTMKKNIVDCESIIEKFKQWKVRKFNYKSESDGTPLNYGLIAQEIETIHSDLVNADFPVEDEEGNEVMKKTVKDHQLMMMSFKALQEAIAKIETLEAKVAALEGS